MRNVALNTGRCRHRANKLLQGAKRRQRGCFLMKQSLPKQIWGNGCQLTWRKCQLGGLAPQGPQLMNDPFGQLPQTAATTQGSWPTVTMSHFSTTWPGTDVLFPGLDSESFPRACFRPGIVQSICTYILHEAKLTSHRPHCTDEEIEVQRRQLVPGHTNQKVAES